MKPIFPNDRYYDRMTHMWAQRDPDTGRVRVGIDALALESIGDLAYIALPPVGVRLVRSQAAGSLEAAKMTDELIAPVSGTIEARNEQVLRDPALVNRDCYGAGWLMTVEPGDWKTESGKLVHGADLAAWAVSEIERYRQQGWIHAS